MLEADTDYARMLERQAKATALCFNQLYNMHKQEYFNKYPTNADRNQIFNSIERGTAKLTSIPQLMAYMFSFGEMHNAKLLRAFETFKEHNAFEGALEIVDWGCGLGLGEIALNDFIRAKGFTPRISRVVLIEPSECAVKRAALHVSVLFPEAKRVVICKKFHELRKADLQLGSTVKRLHIISNVLDVLVESEVISLADFVHEHFTGLEYVACVGPARNVERFGTFYCRLHNKTSVTLIANYTDASQQWVPGKNWTIKLKTFHLGCSSDKAESKQIHSRTKESPTPSALPRSNEPKSAPPQHRKPRVNLPAQSETVRVPVAVPPSAMDSPARSAVSRAPTSQPSALFYEIPEQTQSVMAKCPPPSAQPSPYRQQRSPILERTEPLITPPCVLPVGNPSPVDSAMDTASISQLLESPCGSRDKALQDTPMSSPPTVQRLRPPADQIPSAHPSYRGYWITAISVSTILLIWYMSSIGADTKDARTSVASTPATLQTAVPHVTSERTAALDTPHQHAQPKLTGGVRVTAVAIDEDGQFHPVTGSASLVLQQAQTRVKETRSVVLPCQVDKIPSGDHRLSLTVPGYRPSQVSSVEVLSALISDVAITLSPLPARVRFSVPVTNAVFSVYRDGRHLGSSDRAYDLAPFVLHILTFKAENWRDKEVRVRLAQPGVSYRCPIDVERVAAGLHITATPSKGEAPASGFITIDGCEPIKVDLPLELPTLPLTGPKTISLTVDGYRVLNNGQSVILVDRKITNVEFMVERKSWLSRLLQSP